MHVASWFLNWESNPHSLYRSVESSSPDHQGSPTQLLIIKWYGLFAKFVSEKNIGTSGHIWVDFLVIPNVSSMHWIALVKILGEELAWSWDFLTEWGYSFSFLSLGPFIQGTQIYFLLPFIVLQIEGEFYKFRIKYPCQAYFS